MVDEILKVEPQLFGAQVQHTPNARKMELWQTIVNRVNAVGHHPCTRDDIRKRWNDLRGKVRAMAARHHIAVQKTGGGPIPPEYPDWEEKVLAILHPEGLTGLTGGMDSEHKGKRKKIEKYSWRVHDNRDSRTLKERTPEQMEIGTIRRPLTKDEKDLRRKNGQCLYCGRKGHFAKDCPIKPKNKQGPVQKVAANAPVELENENT
ncbi:hypothetical protein NDU88_009599 [Pleurodeles waltl]|uniref:CCHC-type domain-containing protein n=1 Tax=Pleurodeles waltl TaxID=8319 RepID=A0AAV7PWA1_PLEWA|nr:hypothetical protein NDU88_009599 [Pleurodeles waltl]